MATVAGLDELIEEPLQVENSLRYILLTKFPNGMPEDLLAVALRYILLQLRYVHQHLGAHRHIDSTLIGVYLAANGVPCRIGLSHHEGIYVANLDIPNQDGHQRDFRSVGILAMEMAYGSLPSDLANQQLNTIADNLVRILRPKLQIGKERIKGMPDGLNMLLDNGFVDRRERKLQIKVNGSPLQRAKVRLGEWKKFVTGSPNLDGSREFSRGFLGVVMKLLDRNPPTPIDEILELPFILQNKGMDYFEEHVR